MSDVTPSWADRRFGPVAPVTRLLEDTRSRAVTEGLWQVALPLPYPLTKRVNAYVLEQADGWCIVDCGSSLPPGWDAMVHGLQLSGLEPSAVTRLVTTHQHSDHAGLAATVIERTGCEYAHLDAHRSLNEVIRDYLVPLEVRLARTREFGVPRGLVERWATATVADDARHVIPEPDRRLREGDTIPSTIGPWTVYAAPGHSPSQLVLFHEERRWLLSADLVLRIRAPFIEWGHTPDPFAEHLDSLRRVQALDPVLLLPGHGRPVPGVEDQVTFAIGAAHALRQRVEDLLSEGPSTPYALAYRMVAYDADLDQRQAALSTVLAILDHLEGAGAVVVDHDDAGIRHVRAAR